MKKIILITFISSLLMLETKACDICGCGVGNSYIGMLPEFQKHIVGLRYRHNSLWTHVGIGGSTTYLTTSEYYATTELWGAFNIGKRIRLMATIPYVFNERNNQNSSSSKSGLGDIATICYYQLLNKRSQANNKLFIQSLWLGAGFKLPTGRYNPVDKSSSVSSNLFQLGTGSMDFSLNGMYDLRCQDLGINLAANYKINTQNRESYQYGNKLSLNGQLYYKFKVGHNLSLVPNAGILYETSQQDMDKEDKVDISGGSLTMQSFGMETSLKKVSCGINWQVPLHQNLANGIIRANNRIMFHLSFQL